VLAAEQGLPLDWLVAGQTLACVLLLAIAVGLVASFLNQPIDLPELRPVVGALSGHADVPQVLLLLGYGLAVRCMPPRPVAELLVSGKQMWSE
jgi:hypothetical protein